MARQISVDVDAIRRSQAAGMTQSATALALGISVTAVQYHWKRGEKRGPARGTSPNAKNIAAMIADGKTDREIAQALGLAVSTVNRQRRTLQDKK